LKFGPDMRQTWFFFAESRHGKTLAYRHVSFRAVFFTTNRCPRRRFNHRRTARELYNKIYCRPDDGGEGAPPSLVGLTMVGQEPVWIEGRPRFSDFERTFRTHVSYLGLSLSSWNYSTLSPIQVVETSDLRDRRVLEINILPCALLHDITSPELSQYMFVLLTRGNKRLPNGFQMRGTIDGFVNFFGCRPNYDCIHQMWCSLFKRNLLRCNTPYPSNIELHFLTDDVAHDLGYDVQ
jgi:hypothetical protein